MELRGRKRKAGESLESLHADIRRLIVRAYPDLEAKAREIMATDHFIDSLGDADFALKVRERNPASLDEALKIGLRLEVWAKDTARFQSEETAKPRTARAVEVEDSGRLAQQMQEM